LGRRSQPPAHGKREKKKRGRRLGKGGKLRGPQKGSVNAVEKKNAPTKLLTVGVV